MIDEKKALELIAQGEGQHVEFKDKAGITSSAPASELIRNLELLGPKGEMTNAVPMFFSEECGKRIPQAVIR